MEGKVLLLLKKVLNGQKIKYDANNKSHEYLKLTGLVIKKDKNLEISSDLYRQVFNLVWIEENIASARFPFYKDLLLWEEKDRNSKYLLKGELLAEAIQWKRNTDVISKTEDSFIEVSRELDDKRRERDRRQGDKVRKKQAMWTIGTISLAAIISLALFLIQRMETKNLEKEVLFKNEEIEHLNVQIGSLEGEKELSYVRLLALQSQYSELDSIYKVELLNIRNEIDSIYNENFAIIDNAEKIQEENINLQNEINSNLRQIRSQDLQIQDLNNTLVNIQRANQDLRDQLDKLKEASQNNLIVEAGERFVLTSSRAKYNRIVLNEKSSLVISDKLTSTSLIAEELEFFSGASIIGRGTDGSDGRPGRNGASGSECARGNAGEDGRNGTQGLNGKMLSLDINRVIPNGSKSIQVDLRGGNGGNGGKGGNGGNGGVADCSENCDGGDGGNGGNGGNGGPGGDSGAFKISNRLNTNYFNVITSSGRPGNGGKGGLGGSAGRGKSCVFTKKDPGKNGRPGNEGYDGDFINSRQAKN